MLTFKNLLFEQTDDIAFITLNRPDKLNALNVATIQELNEAFMEVISASNIRGVILSGAGDKAFAAGADIEEVAKLNEVNGRKFAENGQEVFAMIESCNKPVLAAINGYALGGGCELALSCHMRIATASSRFGLPEVKLGIIPGYGGTQRLTQIVGKTKAYEMLLTGDDIPATEAKQLGLVNYVVEDGDELKKKSRELMYRILSRAPLAIAHIIDCVNAYYNGSNGYQTEANSFANCCKSDDFREGTAAFLEKRKPQFKGN
ncbi:enoyl-CoA hydratase [Catalinimonas alkaloidigena]|uniref:Enoyl-CoA hydratase n=1 Tax=Catalinimonas alkaloidigena TaxID=1075417 RepID=A0A1G9DWF7_9BACT|nr:enoyl-CoA hydratase-related protein [Catalinimonas alkaloidigena]SDK68187.1 enoyl-CoA hydratase [Catalinimonas alkaloidigena]